MNNEQALELLKEIIKIDSVLGNEQEVADVLQREFEAAGIPSEQVEYSSGRNNLIATLEGSEPGPTLGFTGHMDVVPVGEVEWMQDPFGAEIVDGKLYGRGACDMKAGLVAQIAALINLKENKVPIKGTIKFIATVGEESSGVGSEKLIAGGHAEGLDALVVGEPTDLEIANVHKGALWPQIITYGKTSHGSMPENGVNAIENMAKIVEAFKNEIGDHLVDNVDDVLGHSTYSINVVNGGNGTNVVPDKATLEIDIRTLAGQNHEDIKQQFSEIVDQLSAEDEEFKAEINYINDLSPVNTPEDNEFVQLVHKSVNEITENEKSVVGFSAYTDASNFQEKYSDLPIVICGPAETKYAHQPNEFVIVDDFYDAIKINGKIAENYFNMSA